MRADAAMAARSIQRGARRSAYLLVVLVLLGAVDARAQGRSLDFDLQPFGMAATSRGLLSLEGTQIGAHLFPRAVLQLSYANDPLVYQGFGQTTHALRHRVAAELAFSVGLWDRVEFGLALPLSLYQRGDTLPASPPLDSPTVAAAGVGDLRLVPKVRIFGNGLRGPSLAVVLDLRLPTAQTDALVGGAFGFAPQLVGGWAFGGRGRFSVTAMAGYRFQAERRLYSLRVDDELLFGVGAEVRIWRQLRGIVELNGATLAADPFALAQTTPLVARAALRYRLGDFVLTVGAGPGIVAGYGAPTVQVLASIGYVPGGADSDGDGIPDHRDACPYQAEDKDGFQDDDGCPDLDNDGDGIPDALDRCPNQAEDKDGFQDQDGCPDLDNDGDGIPDKDDKCPNEPEDKDGFEDQDGCPDWDNDKDGIPDAKDKCPNEPETLNGLDDDDGCPEADRDRDGILDKDDKCPDEPEDKNGIEDEDGCPDDPDGDRIPNSRDKCPNEPETYNGYQDEDGCPDDPTPKAVIKESFIVTSESIYFDTDSWDIKQRYGRLLAKVAELITKNKHRIKMIYVEGHADQRGNEKYNQWLSFKRAINVVRYLRRLGIERTKLRALGWGQQRPWDQAGTASAQARNRRVRFHVEYRKKRAPRTKPTRKPTRKAKTPARKANKPARKANKPARKPGPRRKR